MSTLFRKLIFLARLTVTLEIGSLEGMKSFSICWYEMQTLPMYGVGVTIPG